MKQYKNFCVLSCFKFLIAFFTENKSQSPTGDLGCEITELIKCWQYNILGRLKSATPFERVRNKLIDKVFCTCELLSVSCTGNLESMEMNLYLQTCYIHFDQHEPAKPQQQSVITSNQTTREKCASCQVMTFNLSFQAINIR